MVKITQSHGYSIRELRQREKNPQGPNPTPTHDGPTRLGRLSGVSARTVSTCVRTWKAGGPGALVVLANSICHRFD